MLDDPVVNGDLNQIELLQFVPLNDDYLKTVVYL